MKNILFVSPTGGYAGIDVCLETLVYGIDKSKFNPIIVFPKESKLKADFEAKGIKCYSLPLNWWFPIGFSGNDILQVLPNMREKVDPLVHIIQDNKIDLVFTNTSVNLDGAIAAAICNIPHIFFLHAKFVDNIYKDMTDETKAFVYQLMGKLSYKIVCCSRLLHEFISKFCDNSMYIYNGVDINKFKFTKRIYKPGNKLRMICVGHYNANKQQDFVLNALKFLKNKRPDIIKYITFNMVGPGETLFIEKLKKMAKDYDINGQVFFEGFRDDIYNYLDKFDIYINCSITENLPVSVIEAMSCGMPVLAAPNDGTIQLIEQGVTGFISNTPEEMAQRIINIFENPLLIEEMSVKARERVENNFSSNKFISNFEECFHEVKPNKTDNSFFIYNFYESLVGYSIRKLHTTKVLLIYPKEASATYHIAGKIPLDYLSGLGKVEYKSVTENDYNNILVDQADVVYCLRYYHDFAYNVLKYAIKKNKAFIWYIDDNYFALKLQNGKVIHTNTENLMYKTMFEQSSAVIVNSDELYHTGNLLKSNIYRLPTYQILDNSSGFESTKPKGIIRFGFMGTLNRDGDFNCVIEAIENIQKEYGDIIEIDFIGYIPDRLKRYNNVNHFDFITDYFKFRKFFATREWDFGIAPLNDTTFNRSKTNNKYREYSSFRVAGIFSNIKTYNTSIINKKNGILVNNTSNDWYEGIKLLIENKDIRKNIAINAYNDIKENYCINRFAKNLLYIFNKHRYNKIHLNQTVSNSYKISRYVNPEQLCFTKPIDKVRKYNIVADTNEISEIGIIFASEFPDVSGTVTVSLYAKGRMLRQSSHCLDEISYNNWTYFSFKPIYNCGGKILTIKLDFNYTKGKMGVFEDKNNRGFIYKIFNKLGVPVKGMNTLFVDLRR